MSRGLNGKLAAPMKKPDTTSLPIRYLRCLRLAWHFVWLGLGAALVYPRVSDKRRLQLKQRWSRRIIELLAIRIDAPAIDAPPGCLIVANHISWLDIFAINAVRPAAFISKSEVRRWPFFGWLATRNETVFLRRGSRAHARAVNDEIDKLLNHGKDVALFPEGTTSDGTLLRGFHAALLQPAVEAGRPILPLALSYRDPEGNLSLAPAYAGETTLMQCFSSILASPSLTVRIIAAPIIDPAGKSRRELTQTAHSAVAELLGYHERASSGRHGT